VTADPANHVVERLSSYLDGELPDDDKRAIDQHLRACPPCGGELERLRATVGGLAALKRRAPAHFLPSIQQQIHTRSRGRFFGRRWMLFGRIPFEWISLVMIIAMLLYYIVSLQSAPTGVSPG